MPSASISSSLVLFLLPSLVSAFSFQFTSQPTQCGNLSIAITDGTGQPPYSVLIIPYGSSPLPNNVEARTIVNQPFSGDSTDVSFQLKYPATSQFVAVVSDSSAFGSGGTSVVATVTGSNDASCFNPTKTVSPDFPFNIYPSGLVVQCSASRLWWNASQTQGDVTFQGVIPGGDSFSIPEGQITQNDSLGTGFSWTPTVRAGNTLLIIAGDNRGEGTGGSGSYNVQQGDDPSNACLNNNSPSSTAGPPAGGSYPTNNSGGTTGGSGGRSSTNTGAIIGGVIGGLAGVVIIALVGLYFLKRKTGSTKARKEGPVNLFQGDGDEDDEPQGELPQYYRPVPFVLPDPTEVSSAYAQENGAGGTAGGSRYGTSERRHSAATSLTDARFQRAATPEAAGLGIASGSTAASSRKTAMPQLRPVNIIQHDDAGSPVDEADEPETVELPPAYTNIRRNNT
ncbi:hypothetical protein SERLA73DRAFT_98611 [Serpula lacrymans var. lacrymans S7.3]|uniref:Mid2 domain-containing protein n=2 Tax=Serpula lacrymans var. lacrymans TaxID=341189 RepID=F8QFL9_SERL3|nr:uncharacterized protein SERLADRAFT_413076 [Serpula lacrymans var. lacrymans S7.9]EGN92853.1 hypothetical protein SERLA73DRAFT_98611 [Serpula lacrymans var. lacrymans S7.3]EGO29686.1 hypothetical protein SERLADRAFT_413076 [Serpula lacrymans var. lacrymans S7.9]